MTTYRILLLSFLIALAFTIAAVCYSLPNIERLGQ